MIEIRETTLREANAYVEELHRHHGKVVGHKWSLAAYKDGRLCGVAIVGRPTGRYLDHGPISIELDGSVILELADRLISDPGVHIEIGG